MLYLDKKLQERIDQKKVQLDSLRPLPPEAVNKLREQFALDMTYNSNAIEGNTLTKRETYLVISEGITIKGKSLKDHLEAKDHFEALEYLFDLTDRDGGLALTEAGIRSLHALVVGKTETEYAGKYRTGGVMIAGSGHAPPEASDVPALMHGLMKWAAEYEQKLHLVERAAIVHHKLVNIHPFFDGNGRTSRLVMNLLLMRKGYPLAVILKADRNAYYRTLEEADRGDCHSFVRFVAQAVERSLDIYLKALAPVATGKLQPLSEIAPKTPYSAKYLNLLARQGKIAAHKENRDWLTTVEAVEAYRKGRERQR